MHAHVGTVFDKVPDHVIAKPITRDDLIDVIPTVFVIDDDVSVRESIELLIRTAGNASRRAGCREAVVRETNRELIATGESIVLCRRLL